MSISIDNGNESQPSINNTSSTVYTSSAIYNNFPKPFPVQRLPACRPFEYHAILSATNNFDESLVIGRGFLGNVYKGNLVVGSSSIVVAIKRFDSVFYKGVPGYFGADVETLSNVRHNNIVPLIGYCNYGKEMLLVYEYFPKGTLYEHLHTLGTRLSWQQRLKICIGLARALDYLHTRTGNEVGIIHGDVKSSSILLDISWEPKISDFGTSKIVRRNQELNDFVSTRVKGNYGYLDLSYYLTGKLTRKSDVYAFGVVLMEVLCRKRVVDQNLDNYKWGLAIWALGLIKEQRLKHVIDSDIRDEISPNCWMGYVRIAERCLDNDPEHRPTMAEVVSTLESVLGLQEKADIAFQTAWKRISSVITNDKNSGMDFGFRMPGKRKLLLLREKILQAKWHGVI